MAEFATNNQQVSATKATLFFGNYGFHPQFDTHLVPLNSSPQTINAKFFANTLADLYDFLRI